MKEYETEKPMKVYRGYSDDSRSADKWVFDKKTMQEAEKRARRGEFKDKYEALQEMLNIPNKPSNIAEGEIPSGIRMREGRAAGGRAGDVGTGGAKQIEIMDSVNPDWFK